MKTTACGSTCCDDVECICKKACDEDGYCEIHFHEEKKDYEYLKTVPGYWVKAFGSDAVNRD